MNKKVMTIGLVLALAVTVHAQQPATADREQAQQILKETGVTGGLVVHIGCGDGKLTAALHASDAFLVQGLDADVTQARENIRAAGLYRPVSAVEWHGGALPYVDNLVNLIVVADESRVSRAELLRVLAPGGVALVGGKKLAKSRPAEIDEWTHTMHDPGANGVARDRVAGPPSICSGPPRRSGNAVMATRPVSARLSRPVAGFFPSWTRH